MGTNKVTKSEFARQAGVNPSTVTKVCRTILAPAWDGKRVDADHPLAVEYLRVKNSHAAAPAATGIDALYQEATEHCASTGRYSVGGLQRQLKIGYDRAHKIIATMKAAGLVPADHNPNKRIQPSEQSPAPTPAPALRGNAAGNANKKDHALAEANARLHGQREVFEVPDNITAFAHMTISELIERYGTDTAFLDWLKALKAIEDIHDKRLKNAEKSGELISRDLVKVGIIDTVDGAFNRMLTDGAKTIALRTKAVIDAGGKLQELEDLVAKQLGTFIKPTKAKIIRILKNA